MGVTYIQATEINYKNGKKFKKIMEHNAKCFSSVESHGWDLNPGLP